MRTFSVRLSDQDIEFLAKLAKSENATIGDVIRYLILFYKTTQAKG